MPIHIPKSSSDAGARPRIKVVGAAILKNRACLVAQRGSGSGEALKWEFPGGKVEMGETPHEALEREIREELGVEIEVGSWLGRGEHDDGETVVVLDVFAGQIVAGEIRLVAHQRYGWFRAEQIGALDWATADRPVLAALTKLLTSR